MKLGGIILCGGRSTRMGHSKAWMPFGPQPMLTRVVRLLGEAAEPIVVVAGRGQELPELPAGVAVVRDRQSDRGPLEGLLTGLTALAALDEPPQAAYATGCDVPLLRPEFVRLLAAQLADHRAAVPAEGRFLHPLAAIYRLDVVAELQQLSERNELRAQGLFEQIDTARVAVDALRAADPELATLQNLNEPAQYVAALRQAGYQPDPQTLSKLSESD